MSAEERILRIFGRMEMCKLDLEEARGEMSCSPLRHRELVQSVINKMEEAISRANETKNEIYG